MKWEYDEVKYLQRKGFEVEFLSDLSAWFMRKELETNLFGVVEIYIDEYNDEMFITIDRKDIDSSIQFDFIKTYYSRKELKKIIKMLTK